MRVLCLTQLFPNKKQPSLGIFVKERIKKLAEFCELKVIAPVPWFPPFKTFKRWSQFSQIPHHEVIEGLEVFHPRFLLIPKIGRCFYGILYFLSAFPHISRLRKEFDFDILDVHWAYPDGFAGVLLGKLFKKSVVITVRGSDINLYPRYFWLRKLIIYALKQADLVITVSGALKKKILELGIPEDKVKVIPNGVDTKKFGPIDKIKSRMELGLPIEKTIILSVGNLIELKGFHYLIEAISEIKKKGLNNIILLIVGEGRFRSKLEKQIVRLGVDSSVKLVGFKSHEEIPKWYNATDLFCLASEREGWPNVILEALACGIPVVAANAGGIPEIICSKDYGILVEGQEKFRLAEAITRALEKDWDRKKLIEYAQKNSWDKCAEKIFEQFKEVLSGKGARDWIMNIAIINRRYWAKGAIPLIQRSMVKWLTKKDVRVTVFSSDVNEGDSNDKTKFVRVFTRKIEPFDFSGFIFAFFLFFKLIYAHRREKIDILQVHDSTGFYGAYLFSKIYRIPITIFVHGWIYNPVREKSYRKSVTLVYKLNARFCAKYADLIWPVSQEVANGMRLLGARAERVKLWLNSIDLDEFQPQEVKPRLKEEKNVLFVGRFGKEKGLEYLIKAAPDIIRQMPEVKFNIIGDGAERDYFENLSEQLNIKDKVDFKGEISNGQLPKYYSEADVLVMPSLSEGHALVPLEALACGTPVIGSRIDGIVETVVDNYNGLLVEPKNSQAISQAVIKVLKDEDLLKRLSANARSSVEQFSWANRVDRMIEICEELIELKRYA